MSNPVNRRRYHAPRRQQSANDTQAQIISAARTLFTRDGYQHTVMSTIADLARVSVDTIYSSVGTKPTLIRAVIDDVLGEGRGPVAAPERGYVEEIRATVGATAKLEVYALALGRVQPDLAPLAEALREAGAQDSACRQAWLGLADRRAANMRVLAAELRATGEVREDLDNDTVADLIWTTNSPEYYLLLTSRGWTPEHYTAHLIDLWPRLLLRNSKGEGRSPEQGDPQAVDGKTARQGHSNTLLQP